MKTHHYEVFVGPAGEAGLKLAQQCQDAIWEYALGSEDIPTRPQTVIDASAGRGCPMTTLTVSSESENEARQLLGFAAGWLDATCAHNREGN